MITAVEAYLEVFVQFAFIQRLVALLAFDKNALSLNDPFFRGNVLDLAGFFTKP